MQLFFFTNEKDQAQPNRYTLDSINIDDGIEGTAIYDEAARQKAGIPYGGFFQLEHVKTAASSINTTPTSSSCGGTAIWGLNFNTMRFDFLGHYAVFDPEEHYDSTEEVYVLYVEQADLEAIKARAVELGVMS